jgi:hypothetical protein
MPIISIAFYMVIIRVQIAKSGNNSKGLSTHSRLNKDNHAPSDGRSLNPMQVRITTLTETNDTPSRPSNSKFDLEEV